MNKKSLLLFILDLLTFCLISNPLMPVAMAQEGIIPDDPAAVMSGIYSIHPEKSLISNVPAGTTLEMLQKGIYNGTCLTGDITSAQPLGTGEIICFDSEQTDGRSYMTVITGDANGDAGISITDMISVKAHLLGVTPLTGPYEAAADTNFDGAVTITDFIQLKSCVLGLSSIKEGPLPGSVQYQDITCLLGVGETCVLPVTELYGDGAAYRLRDESIAAVSEDWILTGLSPGTTAIDILLNEEIAGSYLITVLNAPDWVQITAEKTAITVGETLTVTKTIPLGTAGTLSLACSDPSVLQMTDDGITGLKEGQASITVTAYNGKSASISMEVKPQASSLTLSQTAISLYRKRTAQLEAVRTPSASIEEILWTSSDPAIAVVSSAGLVTGVSKGSAVITAQTKYGQIKASCTVSVSIPIQIALTFDDGPASASTEKLLDYLKQNNIAVTFFLVGNRMNGNAALVKRMSVEGHEIGYHSYNHATQTGLSNSEIIRQYNKSSDILKQIAGSAFTVWRAPGGTISDRVLAQIPLPHILWTIDTRDWDTSSSTTVKNKIINGAKDGNIILLHDMRMSSVNGAIAAIEYLKGRGYEFVTVTEILTRDGSTAVNGHTYKRGSPPE